MRAFREAVEAGAHERIADLLAEDVVFTSPVAFRPYPGRPLTAAILRAAMRVFEDFGYVREIGHGDDHDHALVFEARIGDVALTGCDFIHTDEHGLIDDFMVMVRPLSGAKALAEAMAVEFETVRQETGL